jgi:hypothetical protein
MLFGYGLSVQLGMWVDPNSWTFRQQTKMHHRHMRECSRASRGCNTHHRMETQLTTTRIGGCWRQRLRGMFSAPRSHGGK